MSNPDPDFDPDRDGRFVRGVVGAFIVAFLLYAGWKAYHIHTALRAWEKQVEIPIPDDRRLLPAK